MAVYSELIKNFDKIRDYMRDFFIYGFKTRKDYQYKSLRTYDNEKRRLQSWLGDFFREDNSSKGKSVSVSLDSSRLAENPLYNCYLSKTFTDNDIRLHFLLTDILSNGEKLASQEICNRLVEKYGELFDIQIVRLKLKEYCNEGIFQSEKNGKLMFYKLATDNISPLIKENKRFSDLVKFAMQALPFGEVGSYILKQLDEKNEVFLLKHNFLIHTLEDVILLKLINAIEEHRKILFEYFGKQRVDKTCDGIPLQICCSVQTGRRYVIIYNTERRRFFSVRLDYLRSITLLKPVENYKFIFEKYCKNYPHSWGITFGKTRRNGNYQHIDFTIIADEENEKFIIERLKREGRSGIVTKVGDNLFKYENQLFDTGEISPWIKTFFGRIVDFHTDNEDMKKRFYSDVSRMNEIYNKGAEN